MTRRETWASAAAARCRRLYHSVAVLLPDGTVITAGSIRRAATKSCASSSSIRRICLEGLGR